MLRRLWEFFTLKKNRETLTWSLGGLATVIGAGWAAFTYFEPLGRDEVSNMVAKKVPHLLTLEECISNPVLNNGTLVVYRVKSLLRSGDFYYGWSGGRANRDDLGAQKDFPIQDVLQEKDTLLIKYNWNDGILRLKPVYPIHYPSMMFDVLFQGTWLQTNGTGCVELYYGLDASFQGYASFQGSWDRGPGTEGGSSYIRNSDQQPP